MTSKLYKSVFSMLLVIPVVFFVLYSTGNSNTDRHIRFNGSFVLIDQEGLFREVDTISRKYTKNDHFLSEIKKYLATRKYINNFSIRHSWPNEVIINIEEISPLALIDGKMLIADDCTVHEYPAGINGGSLINFLADPRLSKEHLCRKIKGIVSYIDPSELSRVEVFSNGNYKVFMSGSDFIISGIDVPAEVLRLTDVSQVLQDRQVTAVHIDLRYSSGGAIRPL